MVGALVASLMVAVVKPLPLPSQPEEGQRATQCVQYLRLQPTQVQVDSELCAREGYGLDFMQQRWREIAQLEARRVEEMQAGLARAKARREARSHRVELMQPCRELALANGPGRDGGEALCVLAGLTETYFMRERRLSEQASGEPWRTRARWGGGGVLGLLALVGAGWLRRRGARG